MILNGARPEIAHNYFVNNSTECGRGGALAVDIGANPVVRNNVFANNRAGLDDPMRSSDGGAVSWFDGSGRGVFRERRRSQFLPGRQRCGRRLRGAVGRSRRFVQCLCGQLQRRRCGRALYRRAGTPLRCAPGPLSPNRPLSNVLVKDNVFVGNRNTPWTTPEPCGLRWSHGLILWGT